MGKRQLIWLTLFFTPHFVDAQLVYDWESRSENFLYRVKNIEFFIDRFNNQPEGSGSAHAANPKDTAACLAFMKERDNRLFSLFDQAHIDRKDAALKQKINSFFREVNSPYQPRFIRFEDSYWYAEIIFATVLDGKSQPLRCMVQVASLGNGMTGWVIRSFSSAPAGIQERFRSARLAFPPNVNGTDFMNVRLALQNKSWITEHLGLPEAANSTTLKHLATGALAVESVTAINYHFLQLDGWIMTASYVNRESKNSGWLIQSLQPATATEKVAYLKVLSLD